MQFSLNASDHTDSDAGARRLESRPEHFARIREKVLSRNVLSAGATLDDRGNMVGSSLHLEFDSRQELDKWLEDEPYILNKVWYTVDIHAVKLIDIEEMKKSNS